MTKSTNGCISTWISQRTLKAQQEWSELTPYTHGGTLYAMNQYFKRLHDRCEPPGLEWDILRRLPLALLIGTSIPAGLSTLARLLPPAKGVDPAKAILTVDIFSIATAITFCTAILTVAIGCVVVAIMKGPAYVADAYPVAHANRPQGEFDTDLPTTTGR